MQLTEREKQLIKAGLNKYRQILDINFIRTRSSELPREIQEVVNLINKLDKMCLSNEIGLISSPSPMLPVLEETILNTFTELHVDVPWTFREVLSDYNFSYRTVKKPHKDIVTELTHALDKFKEGKLTVFYTKNTIGNIKPIITFEDLYSTDIKNICFNLQSIYPRITDYYFRTHFSKIINKRKCKGSGYLVDAVHIVDVMNTIHVNSRIDSRMDEDDMESIIKLLQIDIIFEKLQVDSNVIYI